MLIAPAAAAAVAMPLTDCRDLCVHLPRRSFRSGRRRRRRRQQRLLISASLFDLPFAAPAAAAAAAAAAVVFGPAVRELAASAPGEWILYTSPTPFNRSVLLRCPSVSFEDGGELLDGVNDRLLSEQRHYVRLSRGRVPKEETEVVYQRVCIPTGDGGVISLDWPENLDLGGEHGLDSTALLVPGTTEGSMEKDIKFFVLDALKHGYFPVVVNPRGCAGSPITTPRFFSAADSDDVAAAIKFINNQRPHTTLVGVGWGYGASMLTKYIASVAESTPLTAAVCINNPFDLEEATRSFPHHIALDRKLTTGLVNILRVNKELFLGKHKFFDVQKALTTTSVRDFESSITMVSHGFRTVENFYMKNSTRELIDCLKIPVLFIQTDDGTVPLITVPRSRIADNPFTSLLLCSCSPMSPPSSMTMGAHAISWSQNLAVEWLMAVELALLKGRHPLIKDIDIAVNPSKGLTVADATLLRMSSKKQAREEVKPSFLLMNHQLNARNKLFLDTFARIGSTPHGYEASDRTYRIVNTGEVNKNDGTIEENNSSDLGDSQVLQTAAVVLNMLDVTMPGTLNENDKNKVFTAVGNGETLLKALEEAVPENVRGRLTSSVTEFLKSRQGSFSLDMLSKIGMVDKKSNYQANAQNKENGSIKKSVVNDTNILHQSKVLDSENNLQNDSKFITGESSSQESLDPGKSAPVSTNGETELSLDSEQSISQVDPVINGDEVHQQRVVDDQGTMAAGALNNQTSASETASVQKSDNSSGTINESNIAEPKIQQNPSVNQQLTTEKEQKGVQVADDKASQDSVAHSPVGLKTESSSAQPAASSLSTISVSQALDALSGLDDSTQMAVNSVFGVIENMIDQLEKKDTGSDFGPCEDENQDSVSLDDQSSLESQPRIDETASSASNSNKDHMQYVVESAEQLHTGGIPPVFDSDVKVNSNTSQSPSDKLDGLTDSNAISDEVNKVQLCSPDKIINPYCEDESASYFNEYFHEKILLESAVLNSTTDLFLDPKEGRWKIADQDTKVGDEILAYGQPYGNPKSFQMTFENEAEISITADQYYIGNAPSHKKHQLDQNCSALQALSTDSTPKERLFFFVSNELFGAVKFEVCRKMRSDLEKLQGGLMHDIMKYTTLVSQEIVHNCNFYLISSARNSSSGKCGVVDGDRIVQAISTAIQECIYLPKILPAGVIVGITLASLRKYFDIGTRHYNIPSDKNDVSLKKEEHCVVPGSNNKNVISCDDKTEHSLWNNNKTAGATEMNGDGMMAGAVTVALGASALLADHQHNSIIKSSKKSGDSPSTSLQRGGCEQDDEKLENVVEEKGLISSFAEKALSVAAPVVPTKDDGEVDHERLVAVLAELGQKGGILRFVGKIALLWGGIRGAMSLTDRLISFLRISERPLLQRIAGFACMVLILWSPVVIPLFPSLVQSWSLNSSTGFAGYLCTLGLYISISILVMLWGKRIRGHNNPLELYGLDLASPPRVRDFFIGLVGGTVVVLAVYLAESLLGFAQVSYKSSLPLFSSDPYFLLASYCNMFLLAVRALSTAIAISLVEELVFRSWLPGEITVDLGYYRAILISGVAYSLIHRSLYAIPGFMLLNIILFGIKQRTGDKLAAPIGIHAGIMATNYIARKSAFVVPSPGVPAWLASTHSLHPFNGAVGLCFCAVLAVLFFPQRPRSGDSSPVS